MRSLFLFFFFWERKRFLDFRFLEITRGVISGGVSPISSNIDRKTLRVLREWIQYWGCIEGVHVSSRCRASKMVIGRVYIYLQLIIEAAQYDVTWLFIAEFKRIIYRISQFNCGEVTAISCEVLPALEEDCLNYASNEGTIDSANRLRLRKALPTTCKNSGTTCNSRTM
jgi:hypothetical protein